MSTIFFLCHYTYETQSLHDAELLGNYLIVGQSVCKNVCIVKIIPGMLVSILHFVLSLPLKKKKKKEAHEDYKRIQESECEWLPQLMLLCTGITGHSEVPWLKGENANLLVKPTVLSMIQQSRLDTAKARMSQSLSSMGMVSCGVLQGGSPEPAFNFISYSFCYLILIQPYWNAGVSKQDHTLSLLNSVHSFPSLWTSSHLFI